MKYLHKYHKTLELDKILERLAEMTCCEGAAQLAREIHPESDLKKVQSELAKTDGAFTLSARFGTPRFSRLKDPEMDLKRAESGGVLYHRELLNIAAIYRQCSSIAGWKEQCENVETALDPYFFNLSENKYFEEKIKGIVISEEEISDNASHELSQIRRKIKQNSTKVRENLEKIIRGSAQKYLQESIITMRDGRYVVPVKAENRSAVPGLVHDISASGATLFVEPMSVVEANNEIRVLQGKEKEEIERIFAELSAECADFAEALRNNFRLILQLNLYFCKGNLGADMRAVVPEVCDNGKIVLKKARHPLIDKSTVVPIDIELGGKFDSLIVTGPNTGGKTVTLKTLGLLTLMTMCGLMIPVADQSRISVFDRVLVDIGDEQSIEQSLSTFSAHMTNIVSILKVANKKSLVLVDELGSGTDPIEGAALAISIIEEVRSSGAKLAATTHYAELKAYALETDGVENASCEFDVETLRPTYRLLIGVPGRSNAFAISRRLGLKESLLDRAQEYISGDHRRFENVVDELDRSRQQYEKETRQIREERVKTTQLKRELENKLSVIDTRSEQELEKARIQAKQLLDSVRAQADSIFRELEQIKKEKDTSDIYDLAARARSQMGPKLQKLYLSANPVVEKEDDEYILPRALKVGDEVLIYDLDKQGTVTALADKKGMVTIQMGIMKTRVAEDNLRLIEGAKAQKQRSTTKRSVKSNLERSAMSELDLRGCNIEEGILQVDRFIDSCVMGNITQLSIIHGKGTGVLRQGIQNYLKKHPSVKSYRLGTFGEGESGVTIVELK